MPYIPKKGSAKSTNKQNKKNKQKKNNKRTTRKPKKVVLVLPPIIIGKIYSNGCGYCVQMAPHWDEMETQLSRMKNYKFIIKNIEQANEEMQVAEINHTYLQNAPNKLELQGGYPTIFKIVNGQLYYYNSERTAPALVNWATNS
jgi:thiol-disulfide isomerase/thioredoxin